MTLDGKIATRTGESQWITSEDARNYVQGLRHRCDALVTGSGTIVHDKPNLTDRTNLPRRRPLLRVVVDRRGRLESWSDALIFRGTLEELVSELYDREIQSLILECGPDLAFNALRSQIVDKIVVVVAPRILGGREIPAIGGEGIESLQNAIQLEGWRVERAGPDIILTAYVHRTH
jgi:diaminohydroxyphosphoribosylaminopyrimidine deaminase/5-amino-6-(5-phosphoribosylamino)uracil reductase